jgi:uncharacterized protein (DUF1330 family)
LAVKQVRVEGRPEARSWFASALRESLLAAVRPSSLRSDFSANATTKSDRASVRDPEVLRQPHCALIAAVRDVVRRSLPYGFEEGMLYGMIAWSVPLACFADTHNGQPLAIASLAAQKHYSALYLHGVYADRGVRPDFERAWTEAYALYGAVARRHMTQRGGRLVAFNDVEQGLIAPRPAGTRSRSMEYPSTDAFIDMIRDPTTTAALIHRDAGLVNTVVLVSRPLLPTTAR